VPKNEATTSSRGAAQSNRRTCSSRAEFRFGAVFILLAILGFGLVYVAHESLAVPVNRNVAWLAARCFRGFGIAASSAGAVVSVAGFAVEIKGNCNAVFEFVLFSAAVWAYPAPVRAKLLGTILGAIVLYAVNMLRVVSLLVVGIAAPRAFEVSHLYVWQALFLILVGTCWLVWLGRARPIA
jgi:exosortase H (IPTLxxWG-CTERM-specific)